MKNHKTIGQLEEKIRQTTIRENRIKSVSTLTAETAKLIQPFLQNEPGISSGVYAIIQNPQINNLIKAILTLQITEGLRISEVLAITGTNIDESCHIFIKGKKGSSNRIIQPLFYRDIWYRYKKCPYPISDIFSDSMLRKMYEKYGIKKQFGVNVNNSITHVFRHFEISARMKISNDIDTTKMSIGHKSAKTTKIYIDEDD